MRKLPGCQVTKDVDGFGELPGAPGQQRSLLRMCQVFSWALARSAGDRS